MLLLGINSAFHDSSVALIADGQVLFAAEEERFSRIKHDSSFPKRALHAGLHHVSVDLSDVDGIAFGWNQPGLREAHMLGSTAVGRLPFNLNSFVTHLALLGRAFYTLDGKRTLQHEFSPSSGTPIGFIDHHEAHALSALALSGFEEAAVLVVDGHGAWQATSIYDASGDSLRRMKTFAYPNSLGSFYTAFTDWLGFEANSDEWKLMGLAAYGEPTDTLDDIIRVGVNGYKVNRQALPLSSGGKQFFEARFGKRRNPEGDFKDEDRNLAASVQKATEDAMLGLVRMTMKLTGRRQLCLAGGVAMNSKANGRILASGLVEEMFVQPAATDDGTAIGAAFGMERKMRGRWSRGAMDNAYFGPEYSNEDIRRTLEDARIASVEVQDIERVTARLIAEGCIVGWFQGRMEFGPRALGARSILGDPRYSATRDRVNASVKFREEWRPFAPSCLAERSGEYFEPEAESPFMILTFTVRSDKRDVIPAVTHVDNSARVQTVRKTANPRYWSLIHEFDRITGVPVLLNTSFNLRGEPIVCRPQDALRTFFTSGLDFLAIGNFVVAKDDVRHLLDGAVSDVEQKAGEGTESVGRA